MEIKDIVQKAHDNAVKHGFWDPPLSLRDGDRADP